MKKPRGPNQVTPALFATSPAETPRPCATPCRPLPKSKHRCQKMLHHLLISSFCIPAICSLPQPRDRHKAAVSRYGGNNPPPPPTLVGSSLEGSTHFLLQKYPRTASHVLSPVLPTRCRGFLARPHGHAGRAVSTKRHHVLERAWSLQLPRAMENAPRNPP